MWRELARYGLKKDLKRSPSGDNKGKAYASAIYEGKHLTFR